MRIGIQFAQILGRLALFVQKQRFIFFWFFVIRRPSVHRLSVRRSDAEKELESAMLG